MESFNEIWERTKGKYSNQKNEEEELEEPKQPDEVAQPKQYPSATRSFDSIWEETGKKENDPYVDAVYIDLFRQDANRYINSMQREYESMDKDNAASVYQTRKQTAEDLRKRSSAVRQYLEKNKADLDPDTYQGFISYLDQFDQVSSQSTYEFYKFWKDSEKTSLDQMSTTQLRAAQGTAGGNEIAYTDANGRNYTWDKLHLYAEQKEDLEAKEAEFQKNDDWDEKSSTNPIFFLTDLDGMTDSEQAVFNYMYNTQGEEAAVAWYGKYKDIYEVRHNAEVREKSEEFGKEHPFLGTAASFLTNLATPVEYVIDMIDYGLGGERPYNTFANITSGLRGSVEENHIVGEIGGYQVGDMMYSTGASAIDSVIAYSLLGKGGGILLGLSSAAQATNDAYDRGLDDAHAISTGLTAGIAEMIFESISLGKLKSMQEVASTSGREIIKNLTKSMVVNASEEALTEVANIASDFVINGWLSDDDFSEYATSVRMYQARGYTLEEAKSKAGADLGLRVVEAAASGGLMGLGFGTFGQAGAIRQSYRNFRTDTAIARGLSKSDTGMQKLKDLALEVASERSGRYSKRINTKIEKVASDPSARNTRSLYRSVSDAYASRIKSDAVKSLMRKGFSAKEATALGTVLSAEATGGIIGAEESGILRKYQSDSRLIETRRNLLENAKSSVGRRMENLSVLRKDAAQSLARKYQSSQAETEAEGYEPEYVADEHSQEYAADDGNQEYAADEYEQEYSADKYDQEYSDIYAPENQANIARDLEREGYSAEMAADIAEALVARHSGQKLTKAQKKLLKSEGSIWAGLAWDIVDDTQDAPDADPAGGQAADALAAPIRTALETFRATGAISNADAAQILNDPAAISQLVQETGMELPDTASGKRAAVKAAVAQLAQQQEGDSGIANRNEADAGTKTSDNGTKTSDNGTSAAGDSKSNRKSSSSTGNNTTRRPHRRGSVKSWGMTMELMKKSFNPAQKKAYNILRTIANVTGIDIVLFRSKADADGNFRGGMVNGINMDDEQGAFSWHDGKIYVDVNAGLTNQSQVNDLAMYSMLRTFTHEFVHFIEQHNATEYEAFRDLVFEEMREKGTDPKDLIDAYIMQHPEATEDKASREVVAESMTDILPQTQFIKKLAEKKPGLFKKLLERLKAFIKEIKDHFAHMGDTASPEVAAVKEDIDGVMRYAEKIVEAFDRVAVGAVENYQKSAPAQKNTAEGGVQYQHRTTRYDYSKPFSEQIDDFIHGKIPHRDTLVVGGTSKVYQSIGFNALPMTINTTHVDYALNGTKDADHYLGEAILKQLPDKIKDPVAVFVSHTKGKTSVVSLLNFNVNGKQVIAPIVIDGFGVQNTLVIDSNAITSIYGKNTGIAQLFQAAQDEANGKFALLYANKKEARSLLHRAGHQLSGSLIPHDGFYHSIREKNSPVKPKFNDVTETQQFKRWFGDWMKHPKNASKVVNNDGTPKIMYHGSPAQFTIFDKKKARSSGLYGRGFYFTDSQSHAGTYGQQYSVYLNIKNPLKHGGTTVTRTQIQKFLEAVAENEDYSIENYGTYDIDEVLLKVMGYDQTTDAFACIQDINATAIGDMVEATELFNKVNGTEFDGIVVATETVAFYPNQIKSATDNIGTFDGNNPDIRYQRRTATLSNRYLLTNADESVAQTPAQKEILQKYREKAAQLQEIEQQLQNAEKQLKPIAGSKKSEDRRQRTALRNQIVAAKNRITILQDQLKGYEDYDIVREMVARERKRVVQEQLAAYLEKHGTIKAGEKKVRDDSLPISTDGRHKVSRTARTVKGAAATTDELAELIDEQVVSGKLAYLPIKNTATVKAARENLERDGWDRTLEKWKSRVRNGYVSAELTATGTLLLKEAAENGNKEAWLDILFAYQHMGTSAGQAIQAMRILKQLNPEDRLGIMKRSIAQLIEDTNIKFSANDIVSKIDPDIIEAYKQAETYEEEEWAIKEIGATISRYVPSTFMDKFTALRYLNMLGNPRTQIRNIVGNAAMSMVTTVKNATAIGIEQLAYYASGGKFRRTKAFVSPAMIKAAGEDFKVVKSMVLGDGKYSDSSWASSQLAQAVKDNQRIFKNKCLEKYRNITNWAMEQGDLVFSKIAYANALAGYLKANGVKNGDFSNVDAELMETARIYAVKEAQEATFRDTNAISQWISKLGRRSDTYWLGKLVSEGSVPFRKTPANILVRAEEYSPLGFVNTVGKMIKKAASTTKLTEKGKVIGAFARGGEMITGADIVNSLAKGLTGTGLFFMGMWLQSIGVLVGGPDDDEDLDYYQELNGQQNYALRFGDVYITIDFLSPAAVPMFIGAQIQKLSEDGGIELKDWEKSLTSIADPLIEMSMLQGISDALDSIRFSDSNITQLFISFSANILTQGLTNSWLGQIERGSEKSRQTTYVDENSALPSWMQRVIGKASAKIPGWDYQQTPYINAWGEEEENPSVPVNMAYNMLSPSYISRETSDNVSRELTRLNEVQSDVNVFPSTPSKKYNNEPLTAKQYVALAKAQGQTQRKIVESMVVSKQYAELPDPLKAKAISYAYEYAKENAQIEVLDREEFSSKWMAEIEGNAAEGILNHVISDSNIIRSYLRKNEPRIQKAAEAKARGDMDTYLEIVGKIVEEGHFKWKDVSAAVKDEVKEMGKE